MLGEECTRGRDIHRHCGREGNNGKEHKTPRFSFNFYCPFRDLPSKFSSQGFKDKHPNDLGAVGFDLHFPPTTAMGTFCPLGGQVLQQVRVYELVYPSQSSRGGVVGLSPEARGSTCTCWCKALPRSPS